MMNMRKPINDSREIAREILQRQDKLKSDRGNWESHWQEVADRVLPRQAEFTGTRSDGTKRTEFIFDSTASIAAERCAAAIESMLTPSASKWHRLTTVDDDLNDNPKVARYLDDVNRELFKWRYSSKANFANNMHECYMSLVCFGTDSVFVEQAKGGGLRYKAIFLGDLFISPNMQGVIDTVHRTFQFSARQAAQKWGVEALPPVIAQRLEKEPEAKFNFLHCVTPREDVKYGARTFEGMPWSSYYVAVDQQQVVGEGGFWSWPYPTSRYSTAPRETYGRSPAMSVLPEIKMVQEMSKSMIRQVNRAADPVLLVYDDGALQRISTRPGAINRGGINEQGRQNIVPMQFGADFAIAEKEMESRRLVINQAFLVTLFQILIDSPQMTATEAMLRAQEKGALCAPLVGRQQSEKLGPIIERELDILNRMGVLPEPPRELEGEQAQLKIDYESPMTRAMQADEAVGLYRTLEGLAPLAQVDPTILDTFNGEEISRGVSRINGVPEKWLYTPEQVQAKQQGRTDAAKAKQFLEAAPVVSQSALNVAQAQQALQGN